jgi:hypothetical protein
MRFSNQSAQDKNKTTRTANEKLKRKIGTFSRELWWLQLRLSPRLSIHRQLYLWIQAQRHVLGLLLLYLLLLLLYLLLLLLLQLLLLLLLSALLFLLLLQLEGSLLEKLLSLHMLLLPLLRVQQLRALQVGVGDSGPERLHFLLWHVAAQGLGHRKT